MSNKVKIELSEKQYKNLLKLVYLGEWVSQSYNEEPSEELADAVQAIYEASKGNKLENLIELDEKSKQYFPTAEMEENMLEYIDEYDDNVFWDELVDRMAERDFINELGEDTVGKMSFEDRIEKEDPFIEKYEDEFGKNGIDNLKLNKD